MKNYIKNCSKVLLFVGVLLFSCNAFSASEATKKLIHEVLAKYGISSGGKEVCGTPFEPQYEDGVIKCNSYDNTTRMNANNYWSPSERLCKECPLGTLLNKTNYQTCNQVVCPEGTIGVTVRGGKCPEGMELFAPSEGICPEGMELVSPSKGICPEGYELIKITNGKCPDGMELIDLRSSCPLGFEMFKQS